MRYAIFNKNDEVSDLLQRKITSVLVNHQLDYKNPDYIIVIGGDGTFLKAVRNFKNQLDTATFISINTGKLGFYANFLAEDIEKLDAMFDGKYGIKKEHTLLQFRLPDRLEIALNEVTLSNPPHLENFLVYVDDYLFEDYYGNGLLICSPTGSTAYNKSLKGSIIDPKIKGLELTEIASINSHYYHTLGSSVVFDKKRVIKLVSKKPETIMLTYDSECEYLSDFEEIEIKISDKTVKFLTNEKNDFFKRVQKSFSLE